jgi:hypothetical protein
VDGTTYRSTRQTIEYGDAPSVDAKGKTEPISVWQALAARSRFGVDVTHHVRAELVGRERELSVLRDAFERARHERIPQLITLVAVPGMGKSRLVYELSQIVDADAELVTWRQGRCLVRRRRRVLGAHQKSSRRKRGSTSGIPRRRPRRSFESRSTTPSTTQATLAGSNRISAPLWV